MSQPKVLEKLEQLKAYIPFVERMITKLEARSHHDKSEHLEKLKGLYKFLTNPDSRLQNIEMLDRMERIIKVMYKSIGKGSSSSNVSQSKGSEGNQSDRDKKHDSTNRSKEQHHSRSRDDLEGRSRTSDQTAHHPREKDERHRPRDVDLRRHSRDSDERYRSLSQESHRSSSRESDYSKTKESSHALPNPHEKKEKGSEPSYLKAREKELFGDDELGTFKNARNSHNSSTSSFTSSQSDSGRSRVIKHSLLDLPMPPVHGNTSTTPNSKPYLDASDFKTSFTSKHGGEQIGKSALQEPQSGIFEQSLSNAELLKRRLGLSGQESNAAPPTAKPKFNFHEFKFSETSLDSINLNEKESPSHSPAFKTDSFKDPSKDAYKDSFNKDLHLESFKEPYKDSYKDTYKEAYNKEPYKESFKEPYKDQYKGFSHSLSDRPRPRPVSQSPVSRGSTELPLPYGNLDRPPKISLPSPVPVPTPHVMSTSKSIVSTLKASDIPLPSYPHIETPMNVNTPESPDNEPSFSPPQNDEHPMSTPSDALTSVQPVPQVNMEAIQKALNFINAHDKSKRTESSNVSYRYEDFVGPAVPSKNSEYYNPEEAWKSAPNKTLGSMDVDFRSRRREDVDLRQIPGQFLPRPPQPSPLYQPPGKRVPLLGNSTTSMPPRFSHVRAPEHPLPSTNPPDPSWYSSPDIRRTSIGSHIKETKDVDMRTLPLPPLPPTSISSHRPVSHSRFPVAPNAEKVNSEEVKEPSKKPEGSKMDAIRSRVSHDQDKLIKLGQKGVAVSQLESYKQKRERFFPTSGKHSSPRRISSPHLDTNLSSSAPSSSKSSSVTVLDTLLPEPKIKSGEETHSRLDSSSFKDGMPPLLKSGDKEGKRSALAKPPSEREEKLPLNKPSERENLAMDEKKTFTFDDRGNASRNGNRENLGDARRPLLPTPPDREQFGKDSAKSNTARPAEREGFTRENKKPLLPNPLNVAPFSKSEKIFPKPSESKEEKTPLSTLSERETMKPPLPKSGEKDNFGSEKIKGMSNANTIVAINKEKDKIEVQNKSKVSFENNSGTFSNEQPLLSASGLLHHSKTDNLPSKDNSSAHTTRNIPLPIDPKGPLKDFKLDQGLKDPKGPLKDFKLDQGLKDPKGPLKDFKLEQGLKDPRGLNSDEIPRDPRIGNNPRFPRSDSSSRDPRADHFSRMRLDNPLRDPRSDSLPRDPRSDKMASRDPRSEQRDTGLDMPPLVDQRHLSGKIPQVRRDPRLNLQDPKMREARDPRANMHPLGFQQRDPRMGPQNLMNPQNMIGPQSMLGSQNMVGPQTLPPQPRLPQFGMNTRWNSVQTNLRPPFPMAGFNQGVTPPIPVAPVLPTPQFQPASSPKNSAIGMTFTCIMMQGLPHYANSSHIYKFFQEYLLRDICIELDQSYNCKGTAYIHFPNHLSAREALDKENGKFMQGYKIYLRICSVGILRQAKNTHDLQNFDREKYLNIPPRPRGNGNPFYNPKPKPPPPVADNQTPASSLTDQPDKKDLEEDEAQKDEHLKPGYSSLCGVKMAPHGTKSLQSFKIPKLKKGSVDEDLPPESDAIKEASSPKPSQENEAKETVLSKSEEKNKLKKDKKPMAIVSSSDSEIDDSKDKFVSTTKKNRRYRKIIRGIDSDSESDKEQEVVVPKKSAPKIVKKSKPSRISITDSIDSDDNTMVIDESVNISSDNDSYTSEKVLTDPQADKEKVFEDLYESYTQGKVPEVPKIKGKVGRGPKQKNPLKSKEVKTGATRGRKKGSSKAKSRPLDQDIVKTKITRQKHVEFKEILSPKKKLRVVIPLPQKLVYCLTVEDKVVKRGARRLKKPSISPCPSETLSNSSNTNLSEVHSLSSKLFGLSQESNEMPLSTSQRTNDTFSSSNLTDNEKETLRVGNESEKVFEITKTKKRRIKVTVVSDAKRCKRIRNRWQKGYKRTGSPLPEINRLNKRVCYSPPVENENFCVKRIKLGKPLSPAPVENQSCIYSKTLFDDGLIDCTESSDLTHITPTITDKEISIFSVIPELSSFVGTGLDEALSKADKDKSLTYISEESKEERIKMISEDLVQTANKFTEKESQHQIQASISTNTNNTVRTMSTNTNNENLAGNKISGSDDEEDTLSQKVNQLVASLDQSFSASKEQIPSSGNSRVTPQLSAFVQTIHNQPQTSSCMVTEAKNDLPTIASDNQKEEGNKFLDKDISQVSKTSSGTNLENNFPLESYGASWTSSSDSDIPTRIFDLNSANNAEPPQRKLANEDKVNMEELPEVSKTIPLSTQFSENSSNYSKGSDVSNTPDSLKGNGNMKGICSENTVGLPPIHDNSEMKEIPLSESKMNENKSVLLASAAVSVNEHFNMDDPQSATLNQEDLLPNTSAAKEVDSTNIFSISSQCTVSCSENITTSDSNSIQLSITTDTDASSRAKDLLPISKEEILISQEPPTSTQNVISSSQELLSIEKNVTVSQAQAISKETGLTDAVSPQTVSSHEIGGGVNEQSLFVPQEQVNAPHQQTHLLEPFLQAKIFVAEDGSTVSQEKREQVTTSQSKITISSDQVPSVCLTSAISQEIATSALNQLPILHETIVDSSRETYKLSQLLDSKNELPSPKDKTITPESVEAAPKECSLPLIETKNESSISGSGENVSPQEDSKSAQEAVVTSDKREVTESDSQLISSDDKATENNSIHDEGSESDVEDGASIGIGSIPDDSSVISSEDRELRTPDSTIPGAGKKCKREKSLPLCSLIESRRITRGTRLMVPEVTELILWDDGGAVDLFLCDQCDYGGKQRVSHLINFHSEREIPCQFRKEDFSPILRDTLGPPCPLPIKKIDLGLSSWIPQKMTFDEEIDCQVEGCDYYSSSRFDFIYHLLEHVPEAVPGMFHCRLCNFMSDEIVQFYDHVASHTGEFRHTCDRCGQRAFSIESLVYHHKDYHGTQSQEFSSQEVNLEDGWPYIHVCRTCHYVQITKENIEKHIKRRHNGKVEFIKANMTRNITVYTEKKKESEVSLTVKGEEKSNVAKMKVKAVVNKPLKVVKGPKRLKGRKKLRRSKVKAKDETGKVNPAKLETKAVEEVKTEALQEELEVANQDELEEPLKDDTDSQTRNDEAASSKEHEKLDETENDDHEKSPKEDQSEEEMDNEESVDAEKELPDQKGDKSVEEARETNVPVFLGQESQKESSEKRLDEEKNMEEIVNRILLNNYTTRSSIEIKKKISSLDNILKKVDDSLEETSDVQESMTTTTVNTQDMALKKLDNIAQKLEVCASKQKNVLNESEKLSGPTFTQTGLETVSTVMTTNTITERFDTSSASTDKIQEKLEPFMKPEISSLSTRTESTGQMFPDTPLFGGLRAQNKEEPLVGIISRLKATLAEDDLLKKIREKQETSKSVLLQEDGTRVDSRDDSDSDNLVICEDEPSSDSRAQTPGYTKIGPASLGQGKDKLTLKVKPPHELFAEHQEKSPLWTPLTRKCRLRDCAYMGATMYEIGAHSYACHRMYTCIFSECSFVSVSDRLFDPHFGITHKIRKLPCPYNCPKTLMMVPSEMMKHIADSHLNIISEGGASGASPSIPPPSSSEADNGNFLRIESYGTLDPKAASQIFSSTGDPSVSSGDKVDSVTFASPSGAATLTVKTEPRDEPDSFPTDQTRKEDLFTFPGAETLPLHPPTVPLLQLFLEFQSYKAFLMFTGSRASEVFKCMVLGCSFATDEQVAFESHSNSHLINHFRCCYCFLRLHSSNSLVEHVLSEHSHCHLQCKYCLYRAYTKVYLGVHLRKFHADKEPRYVKVGTLKKEPPPNPAIENFVHPYKCTFEQCSFRSVDTDAFRNHVGVHGKDVTLQCIFCEVVFGIDELLTHMKVHMMNEYQCPYCLYGEAERDRLLTHLLNCHPGRPGKVLLRRQVLNPSKGASTVSPTGDPPSALTPGTPTSVFQPNNVDPASVAASQQVDPLSVGGLPSISTFTGGSSIGMSTSGVASATVTLTTTTVTTTTTMAGVSLSTAGAPRSSPSTVLGSKNIGVTTRNSSSPSWASSAASPARHQESVLEQTGLTGVALYRCGNEKCEYACCTQLLLKEHLQVCDFSRDSPLLRCYHCSKHFRHLSGLLDHIKVHGPKRYICGVEGCDYRGTLPHYFKNHMKQVHQHTGYKIVLKDFANKNPETQEFIIYPKDVVTSIKEPHKKRRNEYGFEDLDRIPRTHVLYQDLKCYHCMYATKIRLNLVKHLNLHKKFPNGIPTSDSLQEMIRTIPAKQPINPVPRLERKELMFDKMMNLAGSSFEDKKKREETELRAKHPIPADEFDQLPGLVPEEKLYSCSIDGCKYSSCDEVMLRYHIKTLHSDVDSFRCPHCPFAVPSLDKMGLHFKLHGETLYRCGWCSFLTPRKALVERHLKEFHSSKPLFDFCIRGSETDKDEDAKEGVNTMLSGDSKRSSGVDSSSQPFVTMETRLHEKSVDVAGTGQTGALGTFNLDQQWQCGICPFRSVAQNEMVNHTTIKHGIKSQYKCGYCHVRSSVRTAFDTHFAAKHPDKDFRVLCMYYRLDSNDIEPLPPGGSYNSHEPLWRRNDPDRRKQIRGILLEDDLEENENNIFDIQPGEPKGEEFVCPKCHSFKTPCIGTFRSHLCKEANYQRFECAECGITNPLLPTLRRHYTKTHGSQFSSDCYINLPIENSLEAWVESIISHQQQLIKIWKEGGGETTSSPTKSGIKRSFSVNDGDTSFTEASGVVIHDSGSDKGKYVCGACGMECRTASGLKSHTTAMHQTKYKCQYCPFSSNTELAIQNHIKLKHPKYENSEGNKTSLVRSSEGVESKSAEDKNLKFECSHCNYRSNTARAFYAHCQRSHAEFRSYRCDHCGKRFESQRDGNRHSSWKHPTKHSKIVFSPISESAPIKDESTVKEDGENSVVESKTFSANETKRPNPAAFVGAKSTFLYSCCHCSLRGPYAFIEEHLKAQHRNLPFLVRKEAGKNLYLEVYQYKCAHCATESVSLTEAMDHWVSKHVTLDLKFSLVLSSSSVIRADTLPPATPPRTEDQCETLPEGVSTPNSTGGKMSSPSIRNRKGTQKPDSSSIPSDLEDPLDEEESMSSDFQDITTDSEIESNQVTSSTSEKEMTFKCGYCRKQSKNQQDIFAHIRTAHKDKPMKVNALEKREYQRLYKGLYECSTCGEQGTVKEITSHMSKHLGTTSQMKRILKSSQKDKVCYRCDVCSHVVKARKSIRHHMMKLHPNDTTAFTMIKFESTLRLPTKQPIKCNYCGDTAATVEEMESHHSFLHSHLPVSYVNLREEALQSIHKSSSSTKPAKECVATNFEVLPSSPSPVETTQLPSFSTKVLPMPVPPIEVDKLDGQKNTARKSFPVQFLVPSPVRSAVRPQQKRQFATKSTSGRLQLVRLKLLQEESEEDDEELLEEEEEKMENKKEAALKEAPTAEFRSSYGIRESENFDGNELYASVNLLGGAPMRLSVSQLAALVNLDAKLVLKDIKQNTSAALT